METIKPSDEGRRSFLAASAAAGAVSLLPTELRAVGADAAIRPFQFNAPEADLADLRKRITATKWPERERSPTQRKACSWRRCRALAQYWATEYDWRKCEAKINALPNFITEIDGLDIHFIHVRSKHDNALPMIVTHGWPGSIIEQMKIIDPLTESDRAWRDRGRCLPSRDSVAAGLRLLRQADEAGMEPRQHRESVGDAHATPRLHEIRGAGRRLGQFHFRGDGSAAAAGIARHSHQHGGDGSARCFEGAVRGRPAARRPFAGGKARVGSTR